MRAPSCLCPTIPVMATYATLDDYTDYVAAGAPVIDEAQLERAERDVDSVFAPYTPDATTGLRLDVIALAAWEAAALSRAVCAQAEYRAIVGEPTLAGAAPAAAVKRVKGPQFEKEYDVSASSSAAAPTRFGPKTRAELATIAHLRPLAGRAAL